MKDKDEITRTSVIRESDLTGNAFTSALSKIMKSDAASSRAAIEAAQATKPSLHTKFVYDPSKDLP